MIFTKKRSNSLSRRQLFAGAAAVAILPALPAFAFSEDAARALIDKAVGEINKIINSGSSEASMLRSFEGVFARYADAPRIGQLVLGVDGRSASAAQKRAFAKAFQTYMARKYGRRFREFIGGRIEVQSDQGKGTRFVVTLPRASETAEAEVGIETGVNRNRDRRPKRARSR